MSGSRWLIYGIPLALATAAVWAAHQSALSRVLRGDEIVIASGEGFAPTLNPFLPACEVDRQITALVHEPLLQVDESGHLAPALAKGWSWSQTSRVWFASEIFAKKAMQRVQSLPNDARAKLGLSGVRSTGNELSLQFDRPGTAAAARVLPVIAEAGPLPVEFVRVEMNEAARGYHEFFLKNAVERDQVKSAWFDGANAYELAVSGETVKFIEELSLFYKNRPALQARVRSTGTAPMLHTPVLELVLRDGAKFTDGSDVTAEDVVATVRFVLEQPWPVPGRDALRLITSLDAKDPRTVRASFKELFGPALTAFLGVPVLPAAWFTKNAQLLTREGARAFVEAPPPGAGAGRIESLNQRAVFVRMGKERRLEFLLDQPPTAIRTGFAMHVVDCFWPQWESVPALSHDRDVVVRSTEARSRLLVIWNCRKPPLDDVRVREAMELAVDRPALIQELLHGEGEIHEGIFFPGLWFAQNFTPIAFNRDLAVRLLQDAGWTRQGGGPLTKNGKVFRLELLSVAGNAQRVLIASRLREAWSALGIVTTVTSLPASELVGVRLPEHRFDGALLGLDFELDWDQAPLWHSSAARGGLNFSGLTDPTLDGLLEAARAEFDLEKVPPLAHAVEDRIMSIHPFLPLFSGGSPVAIRRGALALLQKDARMLDLRRTVK